MGLESLEKSLQNLYKEREVAKMYIANYKKSLSRIRGAIVIKRKEIKDEKQLDTEKTLKTIKKARRKQKREKQTT